MNAPWVYALILGISILTSPGIDKRSSARPQPAAVTAEETWTIPGAGRTPGQNNTFFVSDLALTNLGSSTANVTISFVGPGGLPAKPITLAAGATTVYRNVLDALWGATGLVGALSVHADQPLVLRARTYNTAATGTFGVALPVYASGDLLDNRLIGDSIWIQQSASGTSGFRTNVGVVFPDAGGGEAVVTFYDASGVSIGGLTYSSESPGFQQQAVASVAPGGLAVARARISVSRGHAAGYAVGVDNVTGDTSLYPFEQPPAGVQDVVVSGVARLNGRNNTFFRTDARFYNPTPEDVTVTARFLAGGSSNPTPQSATVTVPAGRIVEVVDVLGSILNAPVGSGGAVRFTAVQPVAILCRTSNVDPQGIQPGTFGAQQKPVPLASYLSSADAGAVITAIRQDAAFRTNVGFAAGPDGADYRLTLKSGQGATVANATGSLGAFGWAQPSIADLFAGTSIPADATLLVEVTSGTLDVYDASLDNASGDLVVTAFAPVPAAIPASAQIGPSGGSIRSADGRLTLKVPAGALAAPATLSIAAAENTAPNAVGSAYALTPVGLSFARPATLVLAYSNDIAGAGAGALGLASEEGADWLGIMGGSVDTVRRKLSVPVTSTSPGLQPTGDGRVPLSARASGKLGPYGAVVLLPNTRTTRVRDTDSFEMNFVGPSSSQNPSSGLAVLRYVPGSAVSTSWLVNGVPYGNSKQGSVIVTQAVGPEFAYDVEYTAPDCVPPINPVLIEAFVRVLPGPVLAYTDVHVRVRVIEENWRIRVTYLSLSLCAGGPVYPDVPNFTVDYTRAHDGEFSLDSLLKVVDFIPGNTHGNTQSSQWCPGNGIGCSDPALSTIKDLDLTDVTGELNRFAVDPFFILRLKISIPGTGAFIHFTCPTGQGTYTRDHPLFHGADPVIDEVLLIPPPYKWAMAWAYPGQIETAIVTLTPIPGTACP